MLCQFPKCPAGGSSNPRENSGLLSAQWFCGKKAVELGYQTALTMLYGHLSISGELGAVDLQVSWPRRRDKGS